MEYTKLDINTWKRKEYFQHYYYHIPCTYSVTFNLDITNIINKKLKLYPTMLYALSTIINRYPEFRTCFNEAGELGVYSKLIPFYTIFHKDDNTFSNIWTEYDSSFEIFYNRYEEDKMLYANNKGLIAKPNPPLNVFHVSMIPWLSFSHFNINVKGNYEYLLPIFSIAKYYNADNKVILPLSVTVHHAVCDGFHTSRFLNDLQNLINSL